MVWRVSVGAALSMLDAATDIFVISKYYNTEGLRGQANAMLAMIATNMVGQIIILLAQYKKKSWKVKAKEILISLFFLRPAVDAYRVSTNYEDSESTVDPLAEMIFNKVRWRLIPLKKKNICADNTLFTSDHFYASFLKRHAGY